MDSQSPTNRRRYLKQVRSAPPASFWILPILAAGIAVPVYNQGTLVLLDLLLFLIAPVLLGVVLKDRFLVSLWSVALLWSFAQVVSDLLHGGQLFSGVMMTGPLVALLTTGLFWAHRNGNLSIPLILLAAGVGWLVLELATGQALGSQNPWKYGLASPTVVAVLAFAYWRRSPRWVLGMILLGLAGVSLYFDSRFQTGLLLGCFVAIALFDAGARRRGRNLRRQLLVVALATGLFFGYPTVAMSGILGERAYAQQVVYDSNDANYLLASRIELPHTMFLAFQNPVFGIGSYGQVEGQQASQALEFVHNHITPMTFNTRNYLIGSDIGNVGYRAHTQVMSSILFAGVLALPFWVFVVFQIIRGIQGFRSTAAVVLVYLSGLTVWDVFFSPLIARSHIGLGITLFLVGATVTSSKGRWMKPPGALQHEL